MESSATQVLARWLMGHCYDHLKDRDGVEQKRAPFFKVAKAEPGARLGGLRWWEEGEGGVGVHTVGIMRGGGGY